MSWPRIRRNRPRRSGRTASPRTFGFELRMFQSVYCDHLDEVAGKNPTVEMELFRAASLRLGLRMFRALDGPCATEQPAESRRGLGQVRHYGPWQVTARSKKTTPARGHELRPSFIGCDGGHYIRSPTTKCFQQYWFPADCSNSSSANWDCTSFWKDAQMQETTHFKLRDWLVPPIVIPAFLLLLVVIVSLYRG
jgi:hypothetical protein